MAGNTLTRGQFSRARECRPVASSRQAISGDRAQRLGRLVVEPCAIDCADLRIVPTWTRHAWRSGRFLPATSAQSCPGARLHSCFSARLRAGLLAATRILRAAIGVKALARMRCRLGSAVRCSHVNSRCLSSVPPAAGAASRIVPTSPACNPVLPGRPRTTSAIRRSAQSAIGMRCPPRGGFGHVRDVGHLDHPRVAELLRG
jgi:hypothetical protein